MCQCQAYFLLEDLGRLVIVGAAFGVSDDDVACTGGGDHGGGYFAGEGALLFVGAVLSGYADARCVDGCGHGGQMGEWGAENDVAMDGFASECFVDAFGQCQTFGQGGVHLPVTCNNLLSHICSFFYLS